METFNTHLHASVQVDQLRISGLLKGWSEEEMATDTTLKDPE